MSQKIEEFNKFREKMNETILAEGNLDTKRFFNLDTNVYQDGKISAKTKELLGLVSSLVLRCDDCISYHIIKAYRAGWTKAELYEALNVALVVGGSIIIPHMRKAAELLEELERENKQKNNIRRNENDKKNLIDYKKFKIYTDGACIGNPGPGGYAAVILNSEEKELKSLSGSVKETTNNRMELKAVIEALKNIPANSSVKLYSDSAYVLNGISKWIENWKKNSWKTAANKKVKNQDLWKKLDKLTKNLTIDFIKVKGHSGNHFNEKMDKLAKKEAEKN